MKFENEREREREQKIEPQCLVYLNKKMEEKHSVTFLPFHFLFSLAFLFSVFLSRLKLNKAVKSYIKLKFKHQQQALEKAKKSDKNKYI